MPQDYAEYGKIVAIMDNGEKIVYGDPMADCCRKLYIAAQAILNDKTDDVPCGLEAAAVHTRLINKIQRQCMIRNVYDFTKEWTVEYYSDKTHFNEVGKMVYY